MGLENDGTVPAVVSKKGHVTKCKKNNYIDVPKSPVTVHSANET